MNQRTKTIPNSNLIFCEKYLSHVFKQDRSVSGKKGPPKQGNATRAAKPKAYNTQVAPLNKQTVQLEEASEVRNRPEKRKQRSMSTDRAQSSERPVWKHVLQAGGSRVTASSFNTFDPLRTIHFLSQELTEQLQRVLPENNDIRRIVTDIGHALKRIPPELAAILSKNELNKNELSTSQNIPKVQHPESKAQPVKKAVAAHKGCQTPPTLSAGDNEKFQKIMDENTHKLEASCKQLELVCNNLQNEKEMTEKELQKAKDNIELLYARVKGLECEIDQLTNKKIKQLETEKQKLQKSLSAALRDVNESPSLNHFRNMVNDLKAQKFTADETCMKLQYELTLLKMEKEKLTTMLSVRDREIKNIQDEMSSIQVQVDKELNSVHDNMMKKISSMRLLAGNAYDNHFNEIGDATISSIRTNVAQRDGLANPMGDAETANITQTPLERVHRRAKRINMEAPYDSDQNSPSSKHPESRYQEFLKVSSSHCKNLLAAD